METLRFDGIVIEFSLGKSIHNLCVVIDYDINITITVSIVLITSYTVVGIYIFDTVKVCLMSLFSSVSASYKFANQNLLDFLKRFESII